MSKNSTLRENAIGTTQSIIMGVAGTAPAFSIAATTAILVSAVGLLSAASILYSGLIMFGITLAFVYLNKTEVNAGASYIWVTREFNAATGFFAGWTLLVASALFMVSGTIPAASATLLLIAPQFAHDPIWVTSVAACWLIGVSIVVVIGIKPTSYTQVLMTITEIGILLVIIVLSLVKSTSHQEHNFRMILLSPLAFTPSLFAKGALIALFFYWGWDVTVNLNEETRNARRTAGYGAMWAMAIVTILFVTFVTATLLMLSDKAIDQASTNVIFVLANKLLPGPLGYIAVVAVMLSCVGTIETSILQFTRMLFAQGRNNLLHPHFAKLHPKWDTPWVATFTITILGLIFLFLSSGFPSVGTILKDSINAIGLQVAFYYSLTGLACAWHYRFHAFENMINFILLFLWPLGSAIILIGVAFYSTLTFDWMTNLVGLGGIAIGIVPFMFSQKK